MKNTKSILLSLLVLGLHLNTWSGQNSPAHNEHIECIDESSNTILKTLLDIIENSSVAQSNLILPILSSTGSNCRGLYSLQNERKRYEEENKITPTIPKSYHQMDELHAKLADILPIIATINPESRRIEVLKKFMQACEACAIAKSALDEAVNRAAEQK